MIVFIYLIDIQHIHMGSLSVWVESKGGEVPLFWYHAFSDASPTEYLQWSFISLSMLLTLIYGGVQVNRTAKFPWIMILFFIGLFIMLMEDVLDVRHVIASVIAEYYFGIDPTDLDWLVGPWKSFIEITFYFFLGLIMVISFVYILRNKQHSLTGKKFLTAGFIFYGIASVGSATRNLGSWYVKVGDVIIDAINGSMRMQIENSTQQQYLGYHFMDFVIEESLELLGATFILASLLVFIENSLRNNQL